MSIPEAGCSRSCEVSWSLPDKTHKHAMTQAAGRSCYGRSGSGVLESGLRLESLVHTYTIFHKR